MIDDKKRPIRSYVRRQGRITQRQQKAIDAFWDRYVISESDATLDLNELFSRTAPCIMEIGFGMGHTLLNQALEHPEWNFLGIEVYKPGIGALLAEIMTHQVTNIRVIYGDAFNVFQKNLPDNSLNQVQIFFPDPWPKRRHKKRRLIQKPFVDLLVRKLKKGGEIHLATDWQDYAEQMLTLLESYEALHNLAGQGQYAPRNPYRPLTKFEKRGQKKGHEVFDLMFALR